MVSPDGTQSVLVTWTPPNVNIDTGGSTHGGNNNLFISPGKAMKYTYLYTDGQNPGSCSFVISVSGKLSEGLQFPYQRSQSPPPPPRGKTARWWSLQYEINTRVKLWLSRIQGSMKFLPKVVF